MRRGLLKDLANTPTAIACGWRLYADIEALSRLDGRIVTVDLLDGTSTVDQHPAPALGITRDVSMWMQERLERDGIPAGTITSAKLTLLPHVDRGLHVACATILKTTAGMFESSDTARWSEG